jgi:hypothetical protein
MEKERSALQMMIRLGLKRRTERKMLDWGGTWWNESTFA